MVQKSTMRNWCCRWCYPRPDDADRRNAKRRERQSWKKKLLDELR